MLNLIGQSLGRYHVIEQLGEGGMATVYRAYDTRLETDVAVKVIRTENLAPSILERALKRFEREAKALAKLTHANIVKVLDYGEYEGRPYLVMPFLPGGTLKQRFRGQPLPWQDAVRIMLPISKALGYAHEQNIVHRDVKPSNILITQSGDPMLTDFGIAKIIDEEATQDLTGTSAAVGTPEYMAPEQVVSKNVDHRADVYALGIVLYEMVTGRRPFTADTPMAVLFKQASEPLPRPIQFAPELPDNIERILIKALAKKPEDRYQNMGAFTAALENAQQALAVPKASPPIQAAQPRAIPSRFSSPEPTSVTISPKSANTAVSRLLPPAWGKWAIGLGTMGLAVIGIIAVFVLVPRLFKEKSPDMTSAPAAEAPPLEQNQADPGAGSSMPFVSEYFISLQRADSSTSSSDPTTLTIARESNSVDTLDPALAYDSISGELIQNVYETLVFYNGEKADTFVPLLADAWQVSSDGKTWTFHIREGVKFHNGETLKASDVAYSFQRGLLQGGYGSPQWLLAEPFLGQGIDDIALLVDSNGSLTDDREALKQADPNILRDACQKITSAIRADDAAGTVTMTLAQTWGPFLSIIAQPWGSVMSQTWVIENGGWDGSCDTWQNYYAMQAAEDPFSTIANGTGPFILDKLASGEEVVLVRNDSYWRAPAALERIVLTQVDEWAMRFSMMQAGDADAIGVPFDERVQMNTLIGEECSYSLERFAFQPCQITNASNPFVHISTNVTRAQNILLPNFNISTTDGNQYILSGRLDGNGIPPDFFADVHIRKAFAYCFDLDSLIDEVYSGDAIQSSQLLLPGMFGFDPDALHYSHDLGLCEQEFKFADVDQDGIPAGDDPNDVWAIGFHLQIPYNQGNTTRQKIAEILASNLASVNDQFVVDILGLPWPDYLRELRVYKFPLLTGSWLSDISDPHNLLPIYTTGTYGIRQSLPESLTDQFKDLLNRAISETDSTSRRDLYRQITRLYYEQAVGIPLAVETNHYYLQRWVQGLIINPFFQGYYFYPMYKE